jgi:hypothetical protein
MKSSNNRQNPFCQEGFHSEYFSPAKDQLVGSGPLPKVLLFDLLTEL